MLVSLFANFAKLKNLQKRDLERDQSSILATGSFKIMGKKAMNSRWNDTKQQDKYAIQQADLDISKRLSADR